mmetsp:Transcript_8758/g.18685  ORF Transcript_8758/g.18685 Transcript_8758/m.18685 type:complete len:249 (+) Transcript_8758:775-1521(+)
MSLLRALTSSSSTCSSSLSQPSISSSSSPQPSAPAPADEPAAGREGAAAGAGLAEVGRVAVEVLEEGAGAGVAEEVCAAAPETERERSGAEGGFTARPVEDMRLDTAQVSTEPAPMVGDCAAVLPSPPAPAAAPAAAASFMRRLWSSLRVVVKMSRHCRAAWRTSPMGSMVSGATDGRMRIAASSALWYVAVATMALSPATLAGGNMSLSALVNALSSTRLQVASPRYLATLPNSTVVLARMEGSSST